MSRSRTPVPAIALSRTRALDDTDGATRQTVEKMCELIRDSASDPFVEQCAAYARDHFAMGSSDPAALAWGVFWYVKHCVKFRLDEATMFQIGEQQQQDLLIAPAVLVRMRDPSEDCDGFTMLTAALLTCLGVPVLIATVATEPDDPSRWSHVFLCAIINGRVKPLDTSHGMAPGWMVPRSRINRWQTWTLDGRPADVSIPSYQGLHAYQTYPGLGQVNGRRLVRTPLMLTPKRGRGFGGLGQACSTSVCLDTDVETGLCDSWDDSSCGGTLLPISSSTGELGASGSLPTSVSDGCPAGYTLSGFTCVATNPSSNFLNSSTPGYGASVTPNYGAVAGAAVAAIGQDVKAVIQQPQALLNAQTWANLTSYLPIIGIAVLGVVVLTTFAGKK